MKLKGIKKVKQEFGRRLVGRDFNFIVLAIAFALFSVDVQAGDWGLGRVFTWLGRKGATHANDPCVCKAMARLNERQFEIPSEGVRDAFGRGGPRLGGNVDGSYEMLIPNGRRVVGTSRNFYDQSSMIKAFEDAYNAAWLGEQKIGVNILGIDIRSTVGDLGSVDILMEHMGLSRSGLPVKTYGDLRNLNELRYLPEQMREDIARQYEKNLFYQSDPHGMNEMFREVPINGGVTRVDLRLVDPPRYRDAEALCKNFIRSFDEMPREGQKNPWVDQYNPHVRYAQIRKVLGLPPGPHPLEPLVDTIRNLPNKDRVSILPDFKLPIPPRLR